MLRISNMIQDASMMIRAGSMNRVAFDRCDDGFCRVIDLGASLQGVSIISRVAGYIDEQKTGRAIGRENRLDFGHLLA